MGRVRCISTAPSCAPAASSRKAIVKTILGGETEYAIGTEAGTSLRRIFQSSAPVVASCALNIRSTPPTNTSPPAVARTPEVIGARWAEINLAERLWTIAAERMKGDREHRVPLSDAALAILSTMAALRDGAFVFPGAVLVGAVLSLASDGLKRMRHTPSLPWSARQSL